LIERRIKSMLIGQDPLLKEKLWEDMWEMDRIEEFPIYMMGAVDLALWDITAKAAGLPLYKILGGARDRIPAYASTVPYDSIDQYLRICGSMSGTRVSSDQTACLGGLPGGRPIGQSASQACRR
jgi:L-alanine-DL-glutamate epimerase-like enolase superfamily enzyme